MTTTTKGDTMATTLPAASGDWRPPRLRFDGESWRTSVYPGYSDDFGDGRYTDRRAWSTEAEAMSYLERRAS